VQADHVHLIMQILPKLSISNYMRRLKGKSVIQVFSAFRAFTSSALLGQSFLCPKLLCWYGRLGSRGDTEVCKMAGKQGTEARRVQF